MALQKHFHDSFRELLGYTRSSWGIRASERWVSLCTGLRDYRPPCRTLEINKERKWELVSAFQKSLRRGDKAMALRLVSAMDNMPEEYAYFWRRLCVVASEDVGPADDEFASFVIACASVFTPKKTGNKLYDLFCFLAEQMCDLPNRSRIYCSYGVIELAAINSALPELSSEDEAIICAILQRTADVNAGETPWRAWQKKNDWRAEGMLKFVGLRLPLEMTRVQESVPSHKMLFDLPSYCLDMHCRVGLAVLKRLVRGTAGAEEISEFFQQNRMKNPHKVAGWALFFAEGGRIQGELIYPSLSRLEQRIIAQQCGLLDDDWLHLRAVVEEALKTGVIDRVRERVLCQFYGDKLLIAPAQ
jgi:MgsA AAA+ ATPase C terminal